MYIYNIRQTHDVECRATTTDANQIQMIKQRRGLELRLVVIARTPEHQVGGTVEQVPVGAGLVAHHPPHIFEEAAIECRTDTY